MRKFAVLVIFVVAMTATTVRAEFYQWTDSDGKQFYTNEKTKIPEEYRGTAKRVEVDDARVSVDRNAVSGPSSAVREKEHKDKNGHGEAYWHKRAEDLRAQIRKQQAEYDALAKQAKDEQEQPNTLSKSARKRQASREKKMQKIEKKITDLKRELDEKLPEEARKADAYPGWLRE
jgi:predicted  nucleic acid-binding Zn-ribbon protein